MFKKEHGLYNPQADGRFGPGFVSRLASVAGCGLLLAGLLAFPARAQVAKEYQIKAAYLYNFAKFVEWPAQRFANDQAPLVIGILGKDPVGEGLQAIAQNHKINGRNIVIKQITTAGEAGNVHLLFFSDDDTRVMETLAVLKWGAVLTVGESDKFIAAGGMINFVHEADKVRFEINAAAAEHAGLKISAQLLKLAKLVHTPPDPKP